MWRNSEQLVPSEADALTNGCANEQLSGCDSRAHATPSADLSARLSGQASAAEDVSKTPKRGPIKKRSTPRGVKIPRISAWRQDEGMNPAAEAHPHTGTRDLGVSSHHSL